MLYNKEVKQIKDQIVKQIIGNYLKGAGENTAYLKEVKASNLGAVFLNYGEAIDLTSETLVDYNKSNPKMQSAGTLSLLIKETFDKIDRYAMKCETMEYPTAVVKKDLTKYANSLLDGVNIVAFSEGEADIDLKSDIKVLLREGREEFNKRMSEEENEIKEAQDKATQDPTATEYAPTEEEATDDVEDDSDFIEDTPEEDTDAEEETDETDEEEAGDEETDYDKLAEDEYGSDEDKEAEDETTDKEDKEKNEDDDIPTGESYFSFGEGLTDIATKFKAKIKATIEQNKKDKADKTQVKKDKKIAGFAKLIDDYIAAMSEFIFADDFYTCAKGYQRALDTIYSYEEDRGVKLAYNDVYEEVIDVIYDKADELHDKVAKHVKDNFDIDIDSEADTTSGSGESHMFKRKYGYTTIDPQAFSEMINTLLETERDTLKTFAESRGLSFVANSTDYVITSKTLINTTAVVLAARYKFGFYN